MRAGFEVEVINGGVEVRQLGADRGSAPFVQVTESKSDRIAVALVGRIFADEPSTHGSSHSPDADAVIAAYRSGGDAGLMSLDGEFTLVLIDLQQRVLLVRRDPRGTYPVYFSNANGHPIVGTSLRSLADRLPQRSLSEDYISRFLAFPYAFSELPDSLTVWEGIERIRPQSLMRIDFSGRMHSVRQFDWTSGVRDAPGMTFPEARDEFLRLLQAAVQKRMAVGRVGAHLSGGMDSSSIACVARELLAGPRQDALHTFSLTYESRLLAGEQQLMRDVEVGGRISPHRLVGDEALHFQWFDGNLPLMDEPYAGLFEFASQRAMGTAAIDAGVDVLLTGVGIEHSLESTRLHIAHQLRHGRILKAWSTAANWARAANLRTWTVFGQQGLQPLLSATLPATWSARMLAILGVEGIGGVSTAPWISREFARRNQLARLAATAAAAPYRAPFESYQTTFGLNTCSGNWGAWTFLAPAGVRLSHPFLDTDLVRFCLGLRREFKEQPGCRKRLLREAMGGRLPDSIRCRRFKRGFNDVFWRGLTSSHADIQRMIERSTIFETNWLDRTPLMESLHEVAMGAGDTRAGGRLATTLSLIAWWERNAAPCDLPVTATWRFNASHPETAAGGQHDIAAA
jgi:asparagine synthase (glutamine-hydrolysing)